jgi:hypothetical protein
MENQGLDIVQFLVETAVRVGTLEKAFDHICNNNYSLNKPTQTQLDEFRDKTIEELNNRYPGMGIRKK